MKIKVILILMLAALSMNASARNDRMKFSLSEVMSRAVEMNAIDDSVTYYFGGASHPTGSVQFGEITTNKKTNAFNKTDKEACQWVFISAIKAFHQKALSLGANAIVEIKSNYQNEEFSSDTQFECGVGTFTAGVALKANYIKK